MQNIHLPIVAAPRALLPFGVSVSYHKVWKYAVEGRIPASLIGGKWHLAEADLPAIADAFKA